MSKEKYKGKKGFKKKEEFDAEAFLDREFGPKGTPERDEVEKNMSNAKMVQVDMNEALTGKKVNTKDLDLRMYFDSESGEYRCDFSGNVGHFAEALFQFCATNEMFAHTVKAVYDAMVMKQKMSYNVDNNEQQN